MAIQKNDFIEIEFTGTITDSGEIFDTTKQEDVKKANLQIKDVKPFILSVGNKMLPSGFDNDLEGKEVGKSYTLSLKAKDAFGERQPKLIKMVPTKLFLQQKINPVRGMQLSLDGQMVRVVSSSGGRTLVDFNGPLAGKDVSYTYKILREIKDDKDKVAGLQEFLFRRQFDYEIKDNKIIFKVEQQVEPYIKMFAPKFEELLHKQIEVNIVSSKKE